jgi:hypothetical protein
VGMSRAGAVAAAAILVAVAFGGVAGLGPESPATDAYIGDLQGMRDARSLEEHFALVSDGSTAAPSVMPRGVAAAERTTLGPSLEGR